MKKLNQILAEGVYDPGIFKAFFLAGGPGSGKTFVTASAFTGTGLKVVNSDKIFENGLFASQHYFPLNRVFDSNLCPNWENAYKSILNLFIVFFSFFCIVRA